MSSVLAEVGHAAELRRAASPMMRCRCRASVMRMRIDDPARLAGLPVDDTARNVDPVRARSRVDSAVFVAAGTRPCAARDGSSARPWHGASPALLIPARR